jgi:hypothetical protein
MKFLTIAKLKDSATMLPPAVILPIFEASVAAMNQQKKEGRILEFYYSVGDGKFVGILNYDNADQWAKDHSKIPVLNYMDYEIYALADYDEYVKNTIEATREAMKMMAGAPK